MGIIRRMPPRRFTGAGARALWEGDSGPGWLTVGCAAVSPGGPLTARRTRTTEIERAQAIVHGRHARAIAARPARVGAAPPAASPIRPGPSDRPPAGPESADSQRLSLGQG